MHGAHEVSISGDIIHLTTHGAVSLAEIESFMTRAHAVHTEHGQSFLILDVADGIGLTPEVRKYVAAYVKRTGYTATLSHVIGASILSRSVITLVLRAIELVAGKKLDVRFTGSVTAAQTEIAQHKAAR
jgi:hypothetical protein